MYIYVCVICIFGMGTLVLIHRPGYPMVPGAANICGMGGMWHGLYMAWVGSMWCGWAVRGMGCMWHGPSTHLVSCVHRCPGLQTRLAQ